MTTDTNGRFWLDVEAGKIAQALPEGEIIVSSGISPSASYHIGHYPETLMAEALSWALRDAGRTVRHIHVVDNMDPLRKRYDFLPEEYERYVGRPICLVPNPYGAGSYADHFFAQFQQYFQTMGIAPDEIVRSYEDLYCSGRMVPQIERVLERLDEVRRIFSDFGREVPADWTPVQVLGADNTFKNARPESWDKEAGTIEGVSYRDGGAKLNWRLDWPARWGVLGVDVEPYSQHEHGAAGGSYATGRVFAERIFDYHAPIPGACYGNIHLGDDTVKMSSSKGNLVTPEQALKIIPPSILRYFIVRSRPPKTLRFDPGAKLVNLIDEYKQVGQAVRAGRDHEFADAYRFADIGDKLTDVPFTHLANVYQAALGDEQQVLAILSRTGYEVDKQSLAVELGYVSHWLESYAPASARFSLQKKLPATDISSVQAGFLSALADRIEAETPPDAEQMHNLIHELKETHELEPAEAFGAIYQVLFGQTFGPKLGWFLMTLDTDWLVKRLRREQ